MKKYILLALFLLLPLHSFAIDNLPAKPVPAKFFNDFSGANVITPQQANQIHSTLENYFKSSTNQIAIAVVKTTTPYDIAEYTIELGRKWGVGIKDKNNGVMIVWATEDRQIFIATGYGVEGSLTDSMTKRIIETYIIPEFKAGRYFDGLNNGVVAIIKILSGDETTINELSSTVSDAEYNSNGFDSLSGLEKIFIIIFIIIMVILRANGIVSGSSIGGRSRGGFGGGSSFGGGSFGGGGAGGRY